MNIPDNLLAEGWYWAAWLLWLPLFLRSLFKAEWARLKDSELLNVWLGMIVVLLLLWSLKAGVKPGLTLHLLGAAVVTLCFGGHLAFVALSGVQAGVILNGDADGFSLAINALLLAGSAVAFSSAFTRFVQQRLPPNFFVFIFVNAFFGAALMVLWVGFWISSLLALGGAYELGYLLDEYLPYFILLGFSEAWLSGMVITLFVVYRPKWVYAFDDSRYLIGK